MGIPDRAAAEIMGNGEAWEDRKAVLAHQSKFVDNETDETEAVFYTGHWSQEKLVTISDQVRLMDKETR